MASGSDEVRQGGDARPLASRLIAEPTGRAVVLLVSPHLDDVAFSCGGTASLLARAGHDLVLCSVFTASVPGPTGFALACQTDKGLGPEVDYLAVRRAEDEVAAAVLGARTAHLGLPEAPHRGYGSAPELFAGLHDDDEIAADLDLALAGRGGDVVLAPQGLGGHVDHLQVVRAVRRLGGDARAAWYRDSPYAIRRPDAHPSPNLPDDLTEIGVPLDDGAIEAKVTACAAYATQLGFQFGGEEAMEAAIRGFAADEGARLGLDGPAEALLVPDPGAFGSLGIPTSP